MFFNLTIDHDEPKRVTNASFYFYRAYRLTTDPFRRLVERFDFHFPTTSRAHHQERPVVAERTRGDTFSRLSNLKGGGQHRHYLLGLPLPEAFIARETCCDKLVRFAARRLHVQQRRAGGLRGARRNSELC